jgi:hypothetical protein
LLSKSRETKHLHFPFSMNVQPTSIKHTKQHTISGTICTWQSLCSINHQFRAILWQLFHFRAPFRSHQFKPCKLDTFTLLICICLIATKTLFWSQYHANIGPFFLVCPSILSPVFESFLNEVWQVYTQKNTMELV